LDRLHAYGVTRLFGELAMTIGDRCGLLGRSVRLDNSTLTVYGEYAVEEAVSLASDPANTAQHESTPHPAYGYSKDNRFDLKQMMLHLATTGESAFPVWMEAHSGNVSDKQALAGARERMSQMVSQ
jgi:transposase